MLYRPAATSQRNTQGHITGLDTTPPEQREAIKTPVGWPTLITLLAVTLIGGVVDGWTGAIGVFFIFNVAGMLGVFCDMQTRP